MLAYVHGARAWGRRIAVQRFITHCQVLWLSQSTLDLPDGRICYQDPPIGLLHNLAIEEIVQLHTLQLLSPCLHISHISSH